ncbi:hypothetical protein SEA_KROMP_68 [Streptomyces phage Kromp]|uniref:Uncharacterized protein n=1 Tax=Streptomyces phage Kromp TaxID=2315619 RepID=A0A386K8S4_9CAUD|nr:hypothetical protein SEA_KROMP_68 [Streptomyces phage Kromp]
MPPRCAPATVTGVQVRRLRLLPWTGLCTAADLDLWTTSSSRPPRGIQAGGSLTHQHGQATAPSPPPIRLAAQLPAP